MNQHAKDERLGRTVRRICEEAELLMGDADKSGRFPAIQVYFKVDKLLVHMSLDPKELEAESVERIVAMKVGGAKWVLENVHAKAVS